MYELRSIEFNALPDGTAEVRKLGEESFTLRESCYDFIDTFIAIGDERYKEAMNAQRERYINSAANKSYYNYRIVLGFILCNFAVIDGKLDIDENGIWNFEQKICPTMNECPFYNIVCNPKLSTAISDAELRVLELIAQGMSHIEIGDSLHLSPRTVEAHTYNMLRKMGLKNNSGLTNYYFTHVKK